MSALKILLFLSCWITEGITAEPPLVLHHRIKNSSLCLDIQKSPPYSRPQLSFEDKVLIYEAVTPNYTGKVDYKAGDSSVCINKLTETDSGIYTFSVMDSTFHLSKWRHKLIVQEAVPRPVLQMSVMHSNLSAQLCNITVNCSVLDDWAWSVCDGDSCRRSQRSSFRGVNITISTEDRSVVCRGHNHVSTSNVSENIEATCFNKSHKGQEDTSQPLTVKIIVTAAAVCLFFCVFMVCVVKRAFSRGYNQHQSSPAQLTQNQPAEAQPQPAPRLSSSSSEAEASYENVEPTRPRKTSSPTISPREELRSEESRKIDTVYSYLQAQAGNSDSRQNAKGHMRIREESSCVTLDDTIQPMQIDSVYSVLQKPKNVDHSATDR